MYETVTTNRKISIHALRVEGDQVNPPAWDTDSGISIHALRVEGDAIPYILRHCVAISIHALRVEGDGRRKLL